MRPHAMLRIILAIVCAVNVYYAYLFFATPESISTMYGVLPTDNLHQYLTMTVGALLLVFGLGALLALLRPAKYGAIIIMLLLMHFSIFLIDVIVLSRGQMPWKAVLPEMFYFLVISTALVRWYPLSLRDKKQQKEEQKPNLESKQSEPEERSTGTED